MTLTQNESNMNMTQSKMYEMISPASVTGNKSSFLDQSGTMQLEGGKNRFFNQDNLESGSKM
jgi:hypothetical protein